MDILRFAGEKGLKLIMEEMINRTPVSGSNSTEDKVIHSGDLFGNKKQILIRHGEALYRLLITRQGKLILNK